MVRIANGFQGRARFDSERLVDGGHGVEQPATVQQARHATPYGPQRGRMRLDELW